MQLKSHSHSHDAGIFALMIGLPADHNLKTGLNIEMLNALRGGQWGQRSGGVLLLHQKDPVQGPDDNNFGSRSTHKTAFCEQNFTKY